MNLLDSRIYLTLWNLFFLHHIWGYVVEVSGSNMCITHLPWNMWFTSIMIVVGPVDGEAWWWRIPCMRIRGYSINNHYIGVYDHKPSSNSYWSKYIHTKSMAAIEANTTLQANTKTTIEIVRPLANFPPSIWGDCFLSLSLFIQNVFVFACLTHPCKIPRFGICLFNEYVYSFSRNLKHMLKPSRSIKKKWEVL